MPARDRMRERLPFAPPSDALSKVRRYCKQTGRVIVPLTIREILDEQIVRKAGISTRRESAPGRRIVFPKSSRYSSQER